MNEGYSKTPLVKKLGIKEGDEVLFINEPDHYFGLLDVLPEVKEASNDADFIHLFTKKHARLRAELPNLKKRLKKTGMLWISWPKKTSGVSTDLSDAIVRQEGLDVGLLDTKVCAVDGTWSALKFMYRKADR